MIAGETPLAELVIVVPAVCEGHLLKPAINVKEEPDKIVNASLKSKGL